MGAPDRCRVGSGVLVDTDTAFMRIEVKSTQKYQWSGIRGIYRPNDALVLVDFTNKTIDQRSDYYVLNLKD